MVGTPAFMAPEQVLTSTKQVDAQSDVWAVGATMFALISGRYVHQSTTPNEAFVMLATEPPPRLGAIVLGIPNPISEVVDKALQRNKSDRWESAGAMQRAIRAQLEEWPLPADFRAVAVRDVPDLQVSPYDETVGSERRTKHQFPGIYADPLAKTAHVTTVDTQPDSPQARRRSNKWWLVGALALLGVLALAALTTRTYRSASVAAESVAAASVSAISSSKPPEAVIPPAPIVSAPDDVTTSAPNASAKPQKRNRPPASAPRMPPNVSNVGGQSPMWDRR
jgi:serine/threonine-protein kinase